MALGTTSSLLGGRYRTERLLGRGGMAAVYLAHDERLDRQVAIKRLHTEGPEDAARRFAREAKLGASLNHPNLVWVFDTVADDEGVLIVMEYVEGTTLERELAEQGPLSPDRAVSVIGGVAAALDHAHEQGIVHRDVKPANVLLGGRGAVKLADLGIAMAAEHTRITRSGMILGTASYASPEQLDGRPPTPSSDIYSLAAVAFEALTGVKAHRGFTPVEVALAVTTQPPPDLRDFWPEAPAAAALVLERGMARSRADRFDSAGELARELEAALRDAPAGAPARLAPVRPASAAAPPLPPRHEPPPLRAPVARVRRSVPLALPIALVGAALLLAAGIMALASGGGGKSPERHATRPSPPASHHARKHSPPPKHGAPPPAGPSPAPASRSTRSSAAPPPPPGPTNGVALNSQGYRLMQQGRYANAVPVLRRAVAAFPSGSTSLDYGYALFNLGKSLRLSGHPAEAIPVLERRLRIPDQTATVRRELDAARRAMRGR